MSQPEAAAMPKVFLSHSSKDKDSVRRLAQDLREWGVDVWLDEWEIHVGDSISQMVEAGIDSCDFLAIWITKSAIESGWVQREWRAKFSEEISAQNVVILPLLAESVELPALLRDKRYADFRGDYKRGLNQLTAIPGLAAVRPRAITRVLYLIVGPSGVGKDVIQNRIHFLLQERGIPAHHLQKYTTRHRRPGEKQGRPYIHLAEGTFQEQSVNGIVGCVHTSFGNTYGCDANFCPNAAPGSAVLYNIRNLQVLDKVRDSAVAAGMTVRTILLTADLDSLLNRINHRSASDVEKVRRSETARADVAYVERNLLQLKDSFDLIVDNSDNSSLRQTLEQVLSFITNTLPTTDPEDV